MTHGFMLDAFICLDKPEIQECNMCELNLYAIKQFLNCICHYIKIFLVQAIQQFAICEKNIFHSIILG